MSLPHQTTPRENSGGEVPATGSASGPSNPKPRRHRPLRISSARLSLDEGSSLQRDLHNQRSYGTLPRKKLNIRRGVSSPQNISIPRVAQSEASSPINHSPTSFYESLSFRRSRAISFYDTSNYPTAQTSGELEADVKTNGIRVWYSSFTSIDWLHDSIKDSARQARLRRRRSSRGKLRRQLDRSVGWIIVTIVGFLTAIVAFLIVRSEQWLFDLKEGYCREAWYKSKQFCCAVIDQPVHYRRLSGLLNREEDSCSAWRTWSDVFGPTVDNSKWIMFESEMIEYVAWVIIAVSTIVIPPSATKPSAIDCLSLDFLFSYTESYCFDLVYHTKRLWSAFCELCS
jgi:chloride channel 3/4/5